MKITQEQLISLAYGAECFFRDQVHRRDVGAAAAYQREDAIELQDLAMELRLAANNGKPIEVSHD